MTSFFDFNQVSVILINILGILIGFLVYKHNQKGKTNRILALMTLFMLLWVNFAYIPRMIGRENPDLALSLLKVAWFVTPLLFTSLYFLVLYLVEKEKKYRIISRFVLFFGLLSAFITGFTDLVVASIRFVGPYMAINYGLAMWPFLGLTTFLILATLYILFKEYLKATFSLRLKLQYFLIGIFIFYLANILFNIGLPLFFDIIRFYWIGDYSSIFLLGFTSYAIVARQLFGIKIILAQLLVGFIAFILLIQFLSIASFGWRVLNGVIFILFCIFAYYLIKVIREEAKRREEAEKLAREFEKLSFAKDQFLLSIQHHLRTPLTPVRGYLENILTEAYGKVENSIIKEKLVLAQKSADTLHDLMESLLDIQSMRLGKEILNLEECRLDELIEESVRELKPRAEEKKLYIRYSKNELPGNMTMDKKRIKEVVWNLLDNAIKYTRKGGITVSTEKKESGIRIIVKDTGIGMEKNEIEDFLSGKLFERGKEARKLFGPGRGIGLAISFEFVKAHGGKIWAESEGRNKGTAFFVELPA